MCSCEYSKNFRNSFFYRTAPVAAFELYVSIRKEFSKKKVSGEIAFELISVFHVQIQERTSSSTTTRAIAFLQNLLNFIVTKYLKQEVHDVLCICVDECGPCDLSLTGDIKIYQCHMIKR